MVARRGAGPQRRTRRLPCRAQPRGEGGTRSGSPSRASVATTLDAAGARQQHRVLPTRTRAPHCDHRCMRTTVLLVDDDPAFRVLARRILIAAGLDVVAEAATAAAAHDAALAWRPDTALVDVGLPDGHGVALA